MKRKSKKSFYNYLKTIFLLGIAVIVIFLLISRSQKDNYQSVSQKFGDKKRWATEEFQSRHNLSTQENETSP